MSVNRRYHVISILPLLILALHDQFYKLPYIQEVFYEVRMDTCDFILIKIASYSYLFNV